MTLEEKIQAFIETEYRFYSEELVPYIDLVEVYFGAIPDGLLNEMRKFTGHISSATIDKDDAPEVRIENINAAHTHLRRILLDCFKLMCIHQQDYIKTFQKKYKYYNTSDVDDGNFDVNLHKKSKSAEDAFKRAKDADNTGKNDKSVRRYTLESDIPTKENFVGELDEVYEKYCEAYNAFCEVTNYIDDHFEGVVRVAKKHIFSKIISFAGWAASIGLAILLFYLQK